MQRITKGETKTKIYPSIKEFLFCGTIFFRGLKADRLSVRNKRLFYLKKKKDILLLYCTSGNLKGEFKSCICYLVFYEDTILVVHEVTGLLCL